eukprot:TRINITY_DN64368_c0_g1_i1.p1 TRINITY_DN64368_c0_g1~~TRINITY_DN64368_c0_g1_i1.p1  ORF type:complete len:308 (-),score=52.39 TRINITY_DN64368_c0_g1_i1:36-959(-)
MVRSRFRVLAFLPMLLGLFWHRRCFSFSRSQQQHADAPTVAFMAPRDGELEQRLAKRRDFLAGALFLAGTGASAVDPEAAHADATPNMIKTVSLYSEGLQLAADGLVFDLRPRIEQEDWTWVREYLRADSYGNSRAYVDLSFALDRVVAGNEDALESLEGNEQYKMAQLLTEANATVWGDRAVRKDALLNKWDEMAAVVSKVMTAVNNYAIAEPDVNGIITGYKGQTDKDQVAQNRWLPFKLPTKEVGKYQRTLEQYNQRCTGILMSGICTQLPAGSERLIAESSQFGMKVNPFWGPSCKDGKCGGM